MHLDIYGLRASVVKMLSKPNDKQLARSGEDLMLRSILNEHLFNENSQFVVSFFTIERRRDVRLKKRSRGNSEDG